MDSVPLLRILPTRDPYGLRLVGEADFTNRQALTAALDAVLDQQPDPALPIRIDVEDLRFADAATAALFGRLALQAPAGVHLTGCRGPVAVVLDLLGFAQLPKIRLTCAAEAFVVSNGKHLIA